MKSEKDIQKQEAALSEKPSDTEVTMMNPGILALTPKYHEGSHKIYVDAINEALNNKSVRNIALSGHYGVGKSSILAKVAQDNKKLGVVTISLSSLRVDSNGSEDSKTNQIQKEIVKQLLYRETPSSTPDSRYKRLAKYDWKKGALPVFTLTLFLYLAMHITGLTGKLVPFPDVLPWLLVTQLTGIYLLLSFLVLFLHATTLNRVWIDKLTTGSTTLSLTKGTDTYFDQFLDELVYFFEVSKTEIVVFEDLDRFNDPTIFENLRALNSLLNNSKQLGGRIIRFIYAVRDSIFESGDGGHGDTAVARSQRTKFFDVVVPVVPFITHSNARDLMTSVMGDISHKVPETLIRIAARHVAEMRVLKNVRNEFLIFREQIFGDGNEEASLGLSEANLYAMVLYKNTHLSDFEKISKAESDIDRLYAESRRVVNAEISRLVEKETELGSRLASLNSIASRSNRLGQKLKSSLELIMRSIRNPAVMTSYAIRLNDSTTLADSDLLTESTWRSLILEDGRLLVTFSNDRGQVMVIQLGSSDLENLLGEALSESTWEKSDQATLGHQIKDAALAAEEYRKADIADLIRLNPDCASIPENGNTQGFKEFTFACLKSDLARELASAGFIDRNFTLYTSVYHSVHVSVRARNFIMKCLEPQVMDAEFKLEPEDVKAILKDISEESLGFTGAYNINLLDYLLINEPIKAVRLVKALANLGESERKFLSSYWTGGGQQLKLAFELAKYTPGILTYLVSDNSIPQSVASPSNNDLENA